MNDKGGEARSGRINLLVHPNGPGTLAPGRDRRRSDMGGQGGRMAPNAGKRRVKRT